MCLWFICFYSMMMFIIVKFSYQYSAILLLVGCTKYVFTYIWLILVWIFEVVEVKDYNPPPWIIIDMTLLVIIIRLWVNHRITQSSSKWFWWMIDWFYCYFIILFWYWLLLLLLCYYGILVSILCNPTLGRVHKACVYYADSFMINCQIYCIRFAL